MNTLLGFFSGLACGLLTTAERINQILAAGIQAENQRKINQRIRDDVVDGDPHRGVAGPFRSQAPHRQHQHGQTDALAERLILARLGRGDDLAARVDHKEAHDGDADLTNQEQGGHDPAQHRIDEFVEDGGNDQCAAGEQFVGNRIHQLAKFSDLVVFAGHPTVKLIGAGRDDEDDRGNPTHGDVVHAPRAGFGVQRQKHDDQDDTREGDKVRRRVPTVKQR